METAVKAKAKWVMDPTHSELTFKVKHMMITNVKGEFKNFSVEVEGEDIFTSPLKVRIEVDSINTNNEGRDAHLRSADFFGVDHYKEIVFHSSSFRQKSSDKYELKGLLTIKGSTKEIELDVEYGGSNKDPWGNEKIGFSVEGKLSRKNWGLNWNAALETGGVLVSDEVKIAGEIQFVKQS